MEEQLIKESLSHHGMREGWHLQATNALLEKDKQRIKRGLSNIGLTKKHS